MVTMIEIRHRTCFLQLIRMHWAARFLAAALSLVSLPVSAEVVYDGPPKIEGMVRQIDGQGVMYLDDVEIIRDYPEAKEYALKNWGLDISTEALLILASGRKVTCTFGYRAERYDVGVCDVLIPQEKEPEYWRGSKSLAYTAARLGLGRLRCSMMDLVAAENLTSRFSIASCDAIEDIQNKYWGRE